MLATVRAKGRPADPRADLDALVGLSRQIMRSVRRLHRVEDAQILDTAAV
jgi:hypothetical protein